MEEYPSTKTSCHSVYTPYSYSAITLIHSINVYTYTPQFRWFLYRENTSFRFRSEESHVSKSMCTRQYWTQSDTLTKWYHYVFHTHLRYSLITTVMKTYIYVYIFHWFLINFFFHERKITYLCLCRLVKITYLCLCRLVFRDWIFNLQIQGSQPHNKTETKQFDYEITDAR
jgi:hypothetical protein